MTQRKPPVTRSDAYDQKFIDALLAGYGPTKAAIKAGYSVASVYKWRSQDADFSKRWEEANEIGVQVQLATLEAEADRRAVEGVEDKVIEVNGEQKVVKKYSDSLLMFRMKKLDPTYRDKVDLNHTGAVNNVMVVPGCTSIDDWESQSQEQHDKTLG